MTGAGEFSVRHLIHEAVDGGVVDPDDIAAKVLAQIPPARTRQALEQTLRHYVVQVASNMRAGHSSPSPSDGTTRRTRMMRDWYASWLRQPMHVGDQWKPMGECTADDLLLCETERRAHAAATLSVADNLAATRAALKKHRKTRVRDLPQAVVAELNGRAVA